MRGIYVGAGLNHKMWAIHRNLVRIALHSFISDHSYERIIDHFQTCSNPLKTFQFLGL